MKVGAPEPAGAVVVPNVKLDAGVVPNVKLDAGVVPNVKLDAVEGPNVKPDSHEPAGAVEGLDVKPNPAEPAGAAGGGVHSEESTGSDTNSSSRSLRFPVRTPPSPPAPALLLGIPRSVSGKGI